MAISQRANFRRHRAATATVAFLSSMLLGCQSVQTSAPSQTEVRVIDASYNAPAIDVDVGTTQIATNIGAASFTNYAFLPPENATAYVYPTGKTTAIAQVAGEFLVSQRHSVLITDSGTTY